ncbi:MAG: DegQ family serine endoprotease [Deltaproteobacteria bacterium]|jgi:serine protease Do|nr:DegQ family serine endoprotease [Deltaproteobacteria bacterium]
MKKFVFFGFALGVFTAALLSLAGLFPTSSSIDARAQQTLTEVAPAAVTPAADVEPTTVNLPSLAPVAKKAQAAVVNIFTIRVLQPGQQQNRRRIIPRPFRGGPPEDFFEEFFGPSVPQPRERKEKALGSGFIFDPKGYIVTNNHVIEGADDIQVKLENGTEVKAEIIGRDPKTDLAILKLTKEGPYPFIPLGDSDKISIGDWLVAIGNPFGLEHTVTTGILSARGRAIGVGPYDDFLQTDALINPGNSGGPLLNLKGEVVGINTVIIGGSGIGFAIPSKLAIKVTDQLIKHGRVNRGWIGVVIQEMTPEMAKGFGVDETQGGALVGDVLEGSPAQAGGIKHGDIILEFDGKPIKAFQELTSVVADTPIGKLVDVVVFRDKKKVTLKLTVDKLQDDTLTQGSSKPHFDFGLSLKEITPEMATKLNLKDKTGLLVESVTPYSVAAEVGIRPQDVLLEINRTPVKTINEYNQIIDNQPPEQPLVIWLKRGNQTIYMTLKR